MRKPGSVPKNLKNMKNRWFASAGSQFASSPVAAPGCAGYAFLGFNVAQARQTYLSKLMELLSARAPLKGTNVLTRRYSVSTSSQPRCRTATRLGRKSLYDNTRNGFLLRLPVSLCLFCLAPDSTFMSALRCFPAPPPSGIRQTTGSLGSTGTGRDSPEKNCFIQILLSLCTTARVQIRSSSLSSIQPVAQPQAFLAASVRRTSITAD